LGCLAIEVTERSHLEILLSQAERIGSIGSWRWAVTQGVLLHGSSTLTELLGCDEERLYATMEARHASIPDMAIRKGVLRSQADAIANAEGYTVEYPYVPRGGQTVYLREIAAPVLDSSGDVRELIGVLQNCTEEYERRAALEKQQKELQRLVEERTQHLERALRQAKDARRETQMMLDRDWLTGVDTRMKFYERCADGHRDDAMSLAMIDLDNFKSVNELYGHEIGDQVLKQVCDIILDSMPAGARLARMGGEEFALTMVGMELPRFVYHCEVFKERIAATAFGEHGYTFHRSVSAGCSFVTADEPIRSALQAADMALVEAKRKGSDRVVVANANFMSRIGLSEPSITVYNVKQGLISNEIGFALQPIVDASSGSVLGLEALVRWRRGDTVLPPSRFLAQFNALLERPSERHWRFELWRRVLKSLDAVPE
ncbi:MAG: diguanylate cyclase, partial [Myxococcota bacterium]|nr:diguanylate cyclase [Myxococcota bacterium]